MTDFLLLEQLHRMILKIPKPRLMYKKGIHVRGFFRPYMSFDEYTEAEVFHDAEESTSVTVRFSSLLGDRGTADTVRNIKGMSVKFHCSEGEYDLICQNLPVFFINDAQDFLKLYDAFSVKTGFDGINSRKFWAFVNENPEALNCALRFYSCEGLSASFLDHNWYSVNTYIWKNSCGKALLVRYQWRPLREREENDAQRDSRKMNRVSAEFMAGFDPDRAVDTLEDAIICGRFPSYELQVQMAEYEHGDHPDCLKRTLHWDERLYPPVAIGIMKLTELPEDDMEQCRHTGFAPGNTVKGIELCEDDFSKVIHYAHRMGATERGGML